MVGQEHVWRQKLSDLGQVANSSLPTHSVWLRRYLMDGREVIEKDQVLYMPCLTHMAACVCYYHLSNGETEVQ